MKYVIAAGLIALNTASSAMAHGGGLNRNGCHNDHSNGSYHCHHEQDNGLDRNAEQFLGALFILGMIAAANNQCTTEWQVMGETTTHIYVAEVNTCNGNIYQQGAVRK